MSGVLQRGGLNHARDLDPLPWFQRISICFRLNAIWPIWPSTDCLLDESFLVYRDIDILMVTIWSFCRAQCCCNFIPITQTFAAHHWLWSFQRTVETTWNNLIVRLVGSQEHNRKICKSAQIVKSMPCVLKRDASWRLKSQRHSLSWYPQEQRQQDERDATMMQQPVVNAAGESRIVWTETPARNNDDGIICGAMRQRGAGLAGAGVSSVAKGWVTGLAICEYPLRIIWLSR